MRAMDVMTGNVVTVTPETSVPETLQTPEPTRHQRSSGGGRDEPCRWHRQRGRSVTPHRNRNRTTDPAAPHAVARRSDVGPQRRPRLPEVTWAPGAGRHDARWQITVEETTDLAEVADLLEIKRIRRVSPPCCEPACIVGIVSRANLVRALAMVQTEATTGNVVDDFAIREALLTELRGRPWAKVWSSELMVRNNIVHVWLSDDQPIEEREAIRIAAENTPGVERVEEHLVHVPMTPVL